MEGSQRLVIKLTPMIYLWVSETWKKMQPSVDHGDELRFFMVWLKFWLAFNCFLGCCCHFQIGGKKWYHKWKLRNRLFCLKPIGLTSTYLKFNLLWEFLHPFRHPFPLPHTFEILYFQNVLIEYTRLTSAFGQCGVMGTDLSSWLKQLKKTPKYMKTMIFRRWTPGSTRQWSLREGKHMSWALWLPQLTSWGEF